MVTSRLTVYAVPVLLCLMATIIGYFTSPTEILREADYFAYYNHISLVENLTFAEYLSLSSATYDFEVGYVALIFLLTKIASTDFVLPLVHGITAALFLFGLYQILTLRQLVFAALLLFAAIWPYSTIIVRQMLAMGLIFFLICFSLKSHLSIARFLLGIFVAVSLHAGSLFLGVIFYLARLNKTNYLSFRRIFLLLFLISISILFYWIFYYDYSYVESGYGFNVGAKKFFLQCLILSPFLLAGQSYLKNSASYIFFRLSIPIPILQGMTMFSQASERLSIFFYCFLVLLSVKILWKIKSVELKAIFFVYSFFFFVIYRGMYAQGD
jgi:hypothetical protein